MITHTKQNWNVGQQVLVGFMNLTVKAAIKTPGDWLPDCYLLTNLAGSKLYKFTPHNGVVAITIEEAEQMVAAAKAEALRAQARETSKAEAAARISAIFDDGDPHLVQA